MRKERRKGRRGRGRGRKKRGGGRARLGLYLTLADVACDVCNPQSLPNPLRTDT